MATTVSDTVVLPDGSVPSNGYIYFTCLKAPVPRTLATVVQASIGSSGSFTASLEADEAGTPYAVRVEYWSEAAGQLVVVHLPNIVPTGSGTSTLASIAAIDIPPNATNTHTIKQGDTLNLGVVWLDEFGRPITLDMVAVASSAVDPLGTAHDLTVTQDTDVTTGYFQLSATATETAAWPVGTYRIDIKYTRNGSVLHSDTGFIVVQEAMTE